MSALPEHVRKALFTDHAAVVRDCRDSVPVKEIAERYGITTGAVKAIRRNAGVVHPRDPKPRPAMTTDQERDVPKLYAAGMSMAAIARKFEIGSPDPIRRVLRENNVTIYPAAHGRRYLPKPRPLVSDDEIAAFDRYLDAQVYARSTRQNFIRYLRAAMAAGTLDPEEVDEKFLEKKGAYRGDVRGALRRFGEFRRATA